MKTPFLFALLCFILCAVSLSAQLESGCDLVFQVGAPTPVAQGCENKVPRTLQIECTKSAIKDHIENRLVMPLALKNRRGEIISKSCNFSFVIDKEGKVASVRQKDCDNFWLHAVKQASDGFPVLTPGGYNGEKQCVALDIGISFRETVFSDLVLASFTDELGNSIFSFPKKEEYEAIFKVVEDMPRFYSADCEELPTKAERKACAAKAMREVIYSNLRYPEEARKLGIEETVVVQFRIQKTGELTHAKVVRAPREDLSEEALRLVEEHFTAPWVPGKQRGRPVPVQFNLPIKFELNK
ncbi:energy transducer TonB [Phaeodactylibacter sp.]|uniref:energy transducer TonB n=1 Tax=Phaeodactylibacter sp. TaxID=1940289 RepID=UPI0025D0379F|nr:energy transducer TonB [Phaeodactylibacter sp.]MCI4650570.1 energy transducer TonB [Phaeodactylibacter sp.]MCI5089323.1 energy transducer TonB [Phaeodactylibacter sp.]